MRVRACGNGLSSHDRRIPCLYISFCLAGFYIKQVLSENAAEKNFFHFLFAPNLKHQFSLCTQYCDRLSRSVGFHVLCPEKLNIPDLSFRKERRTLSRYDHGISNPLKTAEKADLKR